MDGKIDKVELLPDHIAITRLYGGIPSRRCYYHVRYNTIERMGHIFTNDRVHWYVRLYCNGWSASRVLA